MLIGTKFDWLQINSQVFSLFTRKVVTLQMLSSLEGYEVLRVELSWRGEHYIIERRYWRFVFGHSETTTFRITVKNFAEVTPRIVVYTLRSVLRGLTMSSLAHFTGVYILQRGCFSVCLLWWAVVGLRWRTGRCNHPRFFYVGTNRVKTIWLWVLVRTKE